MALWQNVFKIASYCRTLNTARFSTSTCLNKATAEEKLGLDRKPKKPLTPYLRYCANIRPLLQQENPNIKQTDLMKLAGERWKTVDEILKKELKVEYEKDVKKYHELIKEYDAKLSPDVRDQLLLVKQKEKARKEKIQLRKQRASLGCPKKPASAFLLFLKSKSLERGSLPYQEWLVRLSNEWKSLTEEEKVPYAQLQLKEKEIYIKKKEKWEKNAQKEETVSK